MFSKNFWFLVPISRGSSVVRLKLLLRDISLRTFFLSGVRYDLRESVKNFPQYICEWPICAVKMVREVTTKNIVGWCRGSKKIFFAIQISV